MQSLRCSFVDEKLAVLLFSPGFGDRYATLRSAVLFNGFLTPAVFKQTFTSSAENFALISFLSNTMGKSSK